MNGNFVLQCIELSFCFQGSYEILERGLKYLEVMEFHRNVSTF